MANNGKRKTFEGAPTETKLLLLFDEVQSLRRILENRKYADRVIAVGSGFFGGAAAVLAKMAIWRD